jgi:colicin import membrane protein
MARRLKTYQTSLGFFDLAIAAPSMKAAAEAWGGNIEDFGRGFAKQTDDPEIVAATMAKPGIVLKRPVGSSARFSEHAELPKDLPEGAKERPAKPKREKKNQPKKVDDKTTRAAALAFEREHKRREMARRKEEAVRQKKLRTREEAILKVERALHLATRRHTTKSQEIERQRAAVEKLSQAEESRWEKEKEKLESALRRARE